MDAKFLEGQPFWIVYLTMLGIVFARVQATYWIGRGLGSRLAHSRHAARVGPRLAEAERLVNRLGPPAVTLTFLFWGLQTAVNLAAGATRMRFGRYLVAMFLGCLVWAAVYSAGVFAAVGLVLGSPVLGGTLLAAALIAVAVALVLRRRRGRAASGGGTGPVQPPPPDSRVPSP